MPAKSFRVAAERMVRQEAASPTDVLRLLGSAPEQRRVIQNEDHEWQARLSSLRMIGEYDAVAFTASKPVRMTRAHNVGDPVALEDAVVDARAEVARKGMAVRLRAPIALTDGRLSTEIMVAPLGDIEGVDGVLLALRAGREFNAADAVRAASISVILALEAARAGVAVQDVRMRQQALGLFELARTALAERDHGERLLAMVEAIANSFGHDVAQLWLLRNGGSLRLGAAHPRESLVLEIARPRDHAPFARALDGDLCRFSGPSLRSWIRRTTHELLIAPLRTREAVSGLLVLGRWSHGYSADDVDLAAECAQFLAPIVAADPLVRINHGAATRDDAPVDDREESLTGS